MNKELEKTLKKIKRDVAKKLQLKSRDYAYFTRVGDYFLAYMIDIAFPDGRFSLSIKSRIKPYVFDDIFWEVFDMESNSSEPMSLRAVGAYTVNPLVLYEPVTRKDWTEEMIDSDKVEQIIYDQLSKIHAKNLKLIQSFETLDDFYHYAVKIGTNKKRLNLFEMLLSIYKENYDVALRLAEEKLAKKEYGKFKNGRKWINQYIVDYCKERLSE